MLRQTLRNDICRCLGESLDGTPCPVRDDCLRHVAETDDEFGRVVYAQHLCDDRYASRIPVQAVA